MEKRLYYLYKSCVQEILVILLIGYFSSPVIARKISISSAAQFKSAVATLVPGDTLEVLNGTYDLNAYINTPSGTANNPIVIKAQTFGGAIFINKSFFDLKQVSYLIIEGFDFRSKDGTVIKMESCNYVRITKNYFRIQETTSLKWILVGGTWNDANLTSSHNRIDHNYFENKTQTGNFITLDGTPDPTYIPSQYDCIDHNHFKNTAPREINEKEAVRLGQSDFSGKSGYTIVEYNLFEDCDGDPEIVSVKTCDDTVRYNTFRNSKGTLCLRQGKRSFVYGNFFFGNNMEGTGGIRVYSSDHKIFNNYMENLQGEKWDAALTITNGDAENSSSNLSNHLRPENIFIGYNTLVDNQHSIEIGFTNNGSYSKAPRNITFANNLVVSKYNQLINIITPPVSSIWNGNVMYPSESAVIGIQASENEIKQVDPKLINLNGTFRLSSSSPVINLARGNYDFVKEDIDGQLRDNLADVGADEYSDAEIINHPLSQNDVGPNGNDFITNVNYKKVLIPHNFSLSQNYPNPFNPSTVINYRLHAAGYISMRVYDILGREMATLVNGFQTAGTYKIQLSTKNLQISSGVYYYQLKSENYSETKKMILIK